LSENPRRRMYLAMAAICGLVASTAGVLKDFVESLNF
jgi:LPS O-antigen subunit length determinant protein (WzzB/FepE family)